MQRYIDVDKLLVDLKRANRSMTSDGWTARGVWAIIERQPAADVAEVRHGRWVQSDLDKDFVTCSECKRMKLQNRMAWNLNTAEHWGLHYCPNCGAKMKGPEGDEMERARKLAEEKEGK